MWDGGGMIRIARAAAAVGLAAVMAAGCGWVSKSVEILDVAASPDGLALELTVASCSAEFRVEIQEDAETVAVWVSSRNGMEPDCAGGVTVQLEAPIEGRSFVDGHDFTEVEVRTGDS
jgi:hypothetical protein